MTSAVFFDVDFTLIHPGPAFQGGGYRDFCARHGLTVDPARFDAAVGDAAPLLDDLDGQVYDPQFFIRYTRRIIEGMGGRGPRLDACAREIYDEWSSYRHFSLYPDVEPTLRQLAADGIRLGLISNAQRSLASFAAHFALDGLIAAAVSSSEHGYMKPHPSIFEAALRQVDVPASAAVMVGDSLPHDIEGARRAGMRAVLVRRGRDRRIPPDETEEALRRQGIAVIDSLAGLPALL
ncbi:MAG TPA: HAD family hydrolase [Vicinamibacterales bacterium]|nr:HAD family hydrolase [Vicinamibacterales bacterium]